MSDHEHRSKPECHKRAVRARLLHEANGEVIGVQGHRSQINDVAVYRAALAWRAQITTLSLAAGLPQQVWAELCRLDSEMSLALRGGQ